MGVTVIIQVRGVVGTDSDRRGAGRIVGFLVKQKNLTADWMWGLKEERCLG